MITSPSHAADSHKGKGKGKGKDGSRSTTTTNSNEVCTLNMSISLYGVCIYSTASVKVVSLMLPYMSAAGTISVQSTLYDKL
jgi:hypothetical protein